MTRCHAVTTCHGPNFFFTVLLPTDVLHTFPPAPSRARVESAKIDQIRISPNLSESRPISPNLSESRPISPNLAQIAIKGWLSRVQV